METHLDQFQMLMILNTPTDKYYGLGGSKRCLGFFPAPGDVRCDTASFSAEPRLHFCCQGQ